MTKPYEVKAVKYRVSVVDNYYHDENYAPVVLSQKVFDDQKKAQSYADDITFEKIKATLSEDQIVHIDDVLVIVEEVDVIHSSRPILR
jgi:hypothetical protein